MKQAVTSKPNIKELAQKARGFAEKSAPQTHHAAKGTSGQVPPNDVRLTANIRRDLHKRLKDAAAQRQYETGKGFTIGELIEELIEQHLPAE